MVFGRIPVRTGTTNYPKGKFMKNHLLALGLLSALTLFTTSSSFAETVSHGLSLYGPQDLKYKPGEPYHYGNPNAPKGGHLTLSAFGAFTKLNPLSLNSPNTAVWWKRSNWLMTA
jgi:microcin C transport system substrate-binding protein